MSDTVDTTIIKFHDLEQLPGFMSAGGELFFESTVKDDWIAWHTTVLMPDGTKAVLYDRSRDTPKTKNNVDAIIEDVSFLRLKTIRLENNNPAFRRIYAWCEQRRDLVLKAMKASGRTSGSYTKELGITMAIFQSLLWGTYRNDELEDTLCSDLALNRNDVFPKSVQNVVEET